MFSARPVALLGALMGAVLVLAACSSPEPRPDPAPTPPAGTAATTVTPESHNIYAAAGAGMLSDAAKAALPLVYVPHTKSGDVWVIDPATFAVVAKYPLGGELQHMVPSYDMTTLYATDDTGNKITPFDPKTGRPGPNIPVTDPYNMYFTSDGRSAISVAERRRELVFYDPHTWKVQDTLPTPDCPGIDHADFTPDGSTGLFTCEFGGRIAVIDLVGHKVLRMIDMPTRNTTMGPQDIKLSPDGSTFFVADSQQGGLWVIDRAATQVVRQIPTGKGAHGIYLSRDATKMYVTNRIEGSVSVLDANTGAAIAKWPIPGGSPDMGNVSADGSQLWLSGRYNRSVYVLSTVDGKLLKTIPVGDGPHGLTVWPQPGRYSLGHTGITR
ncbi:YncE family protein [Pseudonocardia sp. GCM10023141]|uniref:YncE family protein n=1 Tax=Pseudonocardia sp. GCM10023141 TaxID=3252653 RepID=UPI00361EEB22